MPSVPGDHAYDVIYRATADFTDLFAEVAAAKAAMEELKQSTDETNSSSEDGAKAATDAEKARTDAMQEASKAAKEEQQQQILLNKAKNNGFNTPQEAKAFRDQDTQSLLQHNIQENGGRTSPDQALQDIRNKTAALNNENASLTDMRKTLDDSTQSLQNVAKAAGEADKGLSDLEEGSQEVKQALNDTGQALDDFGSKSKSAGSNASQTGNSMKDIAAGAAVASKSIDDVNQSLSESAKAFLEYQQAQKDANAAQNQGPVTSLSGALSNASSDIEAAMREQALATAAQNQSRNNMSSQSLAADAERNAKNNISNGLFSAEALNSAKNSAESIEQEVTPAVKEAEKALESAGEAAVGLSSDFEATTAQGVVLSAAMADVDKKVDSLSKNLSGGFSSAFLKELQGAVKDFSSVSKRAAALDDPAARQWAVDTGKELDSLAMQLQETQRGIEGVGSEFKSSGEEADNFGTVLSKVNSAGAVILANNLEDIENKLLKMHTDLETGGNDWDSFAARIAKTNTQLNAAKKQADALDDPAAKDAVNELRDAFNSLSMQALASKDDLDIFTASETKSSAASVLLSNALESIRVKIDDLKSSMESGNSTWEAFAADLTKANTQLTAAGKQVAALDDPDARNSLNSLQLAFNDLAVEALGSKDNLSVFKTAEQEAQEKADDLAASVRAAKKAAEEGTASFKIFGAGLLSISNYFSTLAAQTKAEGGGSGFLGGLANFFAGGLGGVSSGFSALASLAGGLLPLIIGLTIAIPALATVIAGLATAVGGLVAAMLPMAGIFLTFLPIVLGLAEAAGVLYLAIKPLITAVQALDKATTNSGTQKALKGLSPVMQQAAKDISGFIKALSGAKSALSGVGTAVFAPLLGSLGQLKTVIKPVEEALNTMAGAVGKAIQPVLAGFVSFLQSANFQTLTKAAADSLVYFGGTVSNVLSALGQLAVDAAPYAVQIAKIFDTITKSLDTSVNAGSSNGGISQFLNQMMTGFGILFNIISAIFDILVQWGPALAPIGNFIGNGIAKALHDVANDASKIDFKTWTKDVEQFLNGVSTAFSGVSKIFEALVNSKFLTFLGSVLTDVGNIATALAPIVKFFVTIVADSLPTMQKILGTISGIIVDILKPIDSFLDKVESNKDAMKVLSGIFTALASLVIAGSVLTFFSLLAGMAGKGFSGLIDLINKIPGINLPGGSGSGASGSGSGGSGPVVGAVNKLGTDLGANADENATRIIEAITGEAAGGSAAEGEGAAAGSAAAAEEVSAGFLTTLVSAVIGILIAGAGVALLVWLGTQASNPQSELSKANKKIGDRAATDVLGPSNNLNWFGRVQRDDEHSVQSVGRLVSGGNSAFNKSVGDFFTDNTQWEKASNKAIGDFFTDKTQWEKAADHAISDFFTGNTAWEKASDHAIGDFFSDNTQWEKAANHAIDDFFTGNAGWEKAAAKSISGWFTSAGDWFMRDVYEPVAHWVSHDFVDFFTQSIPHWFSDVGAWFMRDVYEPVKNWVTGDFVNFFTQSIPHWFDDVTAWFMRDVYDPVQHWVVDDIPSFFTTSIPNWFSDVWKWFKKDVADPIGNWLTGTGSDSLLGFFEAGFKDALNAVITDVFNNGLIRILNDALGVVGLSIPKIPTFAGGGHVQGNLGESDTSDSVWAKLTPGEFVIRKRAAAALGPDALAELNQADRPGSLARHAAGGFAGGFSGGGVIGTLEGWGSGLVSGAEGLAGDVASWASSFVSGALQSTFNDAYKAIVDPILKTFPSGTVPTGMAGLTAGSIKTAVDSFLGAQDNKANSAATGALGGSIPTGGQKQIITEALQAAGVAASQWPVWETGLNTLITRESGWNPDAVNRTDSNAAAGNPSEGLAQTTGTTFAEYHAAGTSNNILDPVANVAAAIRYIEATYGSITNVQQANANEAPKGYAVGGFVSDPTLGMGFASGGYMGASATGIPSVKSQAGMNAGGRLSGPGVHVENLNITNPIPEQSGDSLQRAMTRLRVYDGRGN